MTKRRSFPHYDIIKVLQDGVGENKPVDAKVAAAIGNGFCFSLVIDWLFNTDGAEKNYWEPTVPDSGSGHLAYVKNTMGKLRFQYYARLAVKFCDYISQDGASLNHNAQQYFVRTCKGKELLREGSFMAPAYMIVLEVLNRYTLSHYKAAFPPTLQNYFKTLINDVAEYQGIFDKLYQQLITDFNGARVVLVNYIMLDNQKGIFRHTIGIKMHSKSVLSIFDPTFGVYMANDKEFSISMCKMLQNYFADKNKKKLVVYLEYFICGLLKST